MTKPAQHHIAEPGLMGPALMVAMDHRSARLYRLDLESPDQSAQVIVPYDPQGHQHQLSHKDQDRERGQRAHEDAGFYERIAHAVMDAGRVVVVGHGKGHSNAAHHLVEYLQAHHQQVYGRAVAEVVQDLSSLTEPQLLVLGRRAIQQLAE